MARRIGLVSTGSEAPSDAQVMGSRPMHSICPMCKYSIWPLHIKINIYKDIYVHRSTWTVPLARASSLWSVAEVSCPWHNGFGPSLGLAVCNAISGNGDMHCSRFFLCGVAPKNGQSLRVLVTGCNAHCLCYCLTYTAVYVPYVCSTRVG